MSADRTYRLSRNGLHGVHDEATDWNFGYYNPAKRVEGKRMYFTECGEMGCFWESGIHCLDMVARDLVAHYLEAHGTPQRDRADAMPDAVRREAEAVALRVYPERHHVHMRQAYADAYERGHRVAAASRMAEVTSDQLDITIVPLIQSDGADAGYAVRIDGHVFSAEEAMHQATRIKAYVNGEDRRRALERPDQSTGGRE
ncbi:hypothetical protein [Microbacterium gorillae]|uniref:hypothetical protein n=1 Tax=Microbacterium gorillae TaxID=1231063 RepID=UPI003D976E4A